MLGRFINILPLNTFPLSARNSVLAMRVLLIIWTWNKLPGLVVESHLEVLNEMLDRYILSIR